MKELTSSIILKTSALTCFKAEFAFCFFFYLGFPSQLLTIHRIAGKGGDNLFIPFLPLPLASRTLRNQPSYCCREFTSAYSWQLDLNRESLVYQRKSLTTTLRALQITLFLNLHWQLLLLRDCLKITLGNISRIILNLIKRLTFAMFRLLPLPMFKQLTFIFSLWLTNYRCFSQ